MAMLSSYGRRLVVRSVFAICFSLVAAVGAADSLPQILDLSYRPAPFDAGSGIEVRPKLFNGDGDSVTYLCRWFVNGEEIEDFQGPLLPGECFRRGDRIAVEVTPERDGQRGKPVHSGAIEAGNAPPQIVSTPPENFLPGLFRYQLESVDADDDVLNYALLEAPPGMQLDRDNGLLTWSIEKWENGLVHVVLAVEDSFGGRGQQQFTMTLSFVEDEGIANE